MKVRKFVKNYFIGVELSPFSILELGIKIEDVERMNEVDERITDISVIL